MVDEENQNRNIYEDKEPEQEGEVKDIVPEDNLKNLMAEIDAMRTENENLKHQLSEYENIAKRAMADYDNYKKRMERERDEILRYSNEKLIMDLLPIVDNMERAIDSFKDNVDFSNYYEGIKMVLNQIYQLLEKYNVKEIKALGEEFNPYLHHAVAQTEDSEHKSNTVIEVMLKGYMMNDKVIRPSMVKVAK